MEIALELEKELSRRSGTLSSLPARKSTTLGKRKRNARLNWKGDVRAAGVDHSVDVPDSSRTIRRRDRHGLPVVFTRDKFETRERSDKFLAFRTAGGLAPRELRWHQAPFVSTDSVLTAH